MPTPAEVAIIYGLVDPRTAQLRYIGQTTQSLSARLQRHMSTALTGYRENGPRAVWLRELNGERLRPDVEELDRCPAHLAEILEYHYLLAARAAGYHLLNTQYRAEDAYGRFSDVIADRLSALAAPEPPAAPPHGGPVGPVRVEATLDHGLFGRGRVLRVDTDLVFTVQFEADEPGFVRRIVLDGNRFTGLEKPQAR